MKTVYWQKYGLPSEMSQLLFDMKKLETMTARQIYNEINTAADIYVQVNFFYLCSYTCPWCPGGDERLLYDPSLDSREISGGYLKQPLLILGSIFFGNKN